MASSKEPKLATRAPLPMLHRAMGWRALKDSTRCQRILTARCRKGALGQEEEKRKKKRAGNHELTMQDASI